MTKRLLSLLLALATVFSLTVPAYAESGEPADVSEIIEAAEPEVPAEEPEEPAEAETPAEELTAVIAVNTLTESSEVEEAIPEDAIALLSADEPQILAAAKNGLVKDEDGVMRYYTNGTVDTAKNGVAQLADKSSGAWYYVEKGVFAAKTGIAQRADKSNTAWYYVQNGVYTKATGIAQKADKSSSTWYYVKDGVYTKVTGIAQKADKSSATWYYVQNGVYNKTYVGLAPRIPDGKLFYVKNGAYLKTFNGTVVYNGKTYTVKNGAAVVSSASSGSTGTKLPTPGGLYASNYGLQGIQLYWGPVEGAAQYRVFYKVGDGKWTKAMDTPVSRCIWAGAQNGVTYTFTVRCLSADGTTYTSDFDPNCHSGTHADGTPSNVLTYWSLGYGVQIFNCTSVDKGIYLSWYALEGAAQYRIFYRTGDSTSWTKLADTKGTEYLWTGAKEGTTYSFAVRSLSADGKTYTSDYYAAEKTVTYKRPTATNTKLATPKNIAAASDLIRGTEFVAKYLHIQWDAVEGAERYRVFYKTGSGSWKKLGDASGRFYNWGISQPSAAGDYLQSGKNYTFTVRCVSADGKTYTSDYDPVGTTIRYIEVPEITSVTDNGSGINIKWNAVGGASRYSVFYQSGGKWTKLGNTTSTSYTWTGAKSNTVYTFTVRCLSDDGKSYTSYLDSVGVRILYRPAQVEIPRITSLTSASNGVTVNWNPIYGATRYRVFYKNGNSWTKIGDTTSTSFTWTGAKSGTSYTFTVRCLSTDGTTYISDFDTVGESITYRP